MKVFALLMATFSLSGICVADFTNTTKLDSGGVLRQAGAPESLFRVSIPSEIYNRTLTSTTDGINRTTDISFPGSVSFSGQAVVEIYYDVIPGGSLFDHAVIAPLSQYTYVGSNGSVAPNTARLVRCQDRTIVGEASLSITSNRIRLQHSALADNRAPTLIILRYLPSGTNANSVAEGVNGIPRFISIHAPVENGSSTLLSVPTLPLNPATPENLDTDFFFASLQEPGGEQDSTIGPVNGFGPGDGTNLPWQPARLPDGRFIQPGIVESDLNKNGTPDYILPGHDPIPGTDLMMGYYCVDNSYLLGVVGRDTNGNGRIDPSEVLYYVGACPTAGGNNTIRLEYIGGEPYITWEHIDPQSRKVIYFMFNPKTGKLTVTYLNEAGILLKPFTDENGNTIWTPDEDGYNANPPSWSGNARDFPWSSLAGGLQLPRPGSTGGGEVMGALRINFLRTPR